MHYGLIYGLFSKNVKDKFKNELENQDEAINYIETQLKKFRLKLDYNFDPVLEEKYNNLLNSFNCLTNVNLIWDVTDYKSIDKVRERSYANQIVTPVKVNVRRGVPDEIYADFKAMHLENANGGDIYFFPAFILIYKNENDFAIIGYEELNHVFAPTNFVKSDGVPKDSKIIQYTWKYVNKNGSRDMRFKNNFQIPVIRMGGFVISSELGLLEQYLFSNYEVSYEFCLKLKEYQNFLNSFPNK